MKSRCQSKNTEAYKRYGAVGVMLCERWQLFTGFRDDMLASYNAHVSTYGERDTTIDRISGQNGYSPENCRWATIAEQALNKKNAQRVFGDTTIADQRRAHGSVVPYGAVTARLRKGWSPERAVSVPRKRLLTKEEELGIAEMRKTQSIRATTATFGVSSATVNRMRLKYHIITPSRIDD